MACMKDYWGLLILYLTFLIQFHTLFWMLSDILYIFIIFYYMYAHLSDWIDLTCISSSNHINYVTVICD